MITHLEPDILECEFKWALGGITTKKTSGGDGFPAELFLILKYDALKVLHSICHQIWKITIKINEKKKEKSAVATGLEKISDHSNPKEGHCQRMFKLPHNCAHFMC